LVIVQKKILSDAAKLKRERAYVAIRARVVISTAFDVAIIIELKRYSE
jgi:hypothetical protein